MLKILKKETQHKHSQFPTSGSRFSESLTNNQIVLMRLAPATFKVGSKGLDWSMGSIQDPWYARLHPRAARSRAKRAFLASLYKTFFDLTFAYLKRSYR